MSENEVDAVLAQLGQHAGDRERRERLELVEVDREIDACSG